MPYSKRSKLQGLSTFSETDVDPTEIRGQSCRDGSQLSTLTSGKEAKLQEPTLMASASRSGSEGKSQAMKFIP